MDFSVETIKEDLGKLSEKAFLIKYILRSDNWYFSDYQHKPENESVAQMEMLKEILNHHLGIAFHNVLMVGSGKTGCSLSPFKKFKKFDENDSDIDVAIISSSLFNEMWTKIRNEYSAKYSSDYQYVASSVFRGFLNEKNFKNIDEIRPEWNRCIDLVNKEISTQLSILHQVNYRIYRSWEDLEMYHINGLRKLKSLIKI